jgi:hypothetical protein
LPIANWKKGQAGALTIFADFASAGSARWKTP